MPKSLGKFEYRRNLFAKKLMALWADHVSGEIYAPSSKVIGLPRFLVSFAFLGWHIETVFFDSCSMPSFECSEQELGYVLLRYPSRLVENVFPGSPLTRGRCAHNREFGSKSSPEPAARRIPRIQLCNPSCRASRYQTANKGASKSSQIDYQISYAACLTIAFVTPIWLM